MKEILALEAELRINAARIRAAQGKNDGEYRALLLQHVKLKDMLLDAYRTEVGMLLDEQGEAV